MPQNIFGNHIKALNDTAIFPKTLFPGNKVLYAEKIQKIEVEKPIRKVLLI